MEPRFAALREPLFSAVAASINRDQQPAEVVGRIDAAVAEFCCLLAQHFITPPAFKALEYLIRRFKCVHAHACVRVVGCGGVGSQDCCEMGLGVRVLKG